MTEVLPVFLQNLLSGIMLFIIFVGLVLFGYYGKHSSLGFKKGFTLGVIWALVIQIGNTFFAEYFYYLTPIPYHITYFILSLGSHIFSYSISPIQSYSPISYGNYDVVNYGININTPSGLKISTGILSYDCMGAGLLIASFFLYVVWLRKTRHDYVLGNRLFSRLIFLQVLMLALEYIVLLSFRYIIIMLLYRFLYPSLNEYDRYLLAHNLVGNFLIYIVYLYLNHQIIVRFGEKQLKRYAQIRVHPSTRYYRIYN